jgi:hypothetical protein
VVFFQHNVDQGHVADRSFVHLIATYIMSVLPEFGCSASQNSKLLRAVQAKLRLCVSPHVTKTNSLEKIEHICADTDNNAYNCIMNMVLLDEP